MIDDWSSPEGIADGDAIAAWLQQNYQAFGITYFIWRDQIWSPGDEGWRSYSHPSGATDPTSLHMDHVHISVEDNARTGLSGGVVSLPLPAGTHTDQTNWKETGAYWSNFHSGNDLSAPCGTPVLAMHSGTVVIERDQSWSGPWLMGGGAPLRHSLAQRGAQSQPVPEPLRRLVRNHDERVLDLYLAAPRDREQ